MSKDLIWKKINNDRITYEVWPSGKVKLHTEDIEKYFDYES